MKVTQINENANVKTNVNRVVGRLLLEGHLLSYFLLAIGILSVTILGGFLNVLGPVISFIYGVLIVPALSYITFKWFFLRTQVLIASQSGNNLEQKEQGTITLNKGFVDFLIAYFLAFGVLIFTLGIGFPYYIYEQKAWFYKQSVITFPSGKVARSVLAPRFNVYFFKSWGIVFSSVAVLIVLPALALFLLMGGAIFSGTGFVFMSIGAFMVIVNYYFYWSMKWMFSHTELIFSDNTNQTVKQAEAISQQRSEQLSPKQLSFKGNFFNFFVWTIFFLFFSVATLGLGFIMYAYWIGHWFVNHTEIQDRLILETPNR